MANVFAIRFSVKIRKACGAFAKLNLPLGKMVLKSVVCNINTRSPFAAPTSRGLPRTASAPHKGWARF
jgi:hypothetical protein